ncbi:MAG: hypothetical protein V4737_01005 [Curtobacterium sp.]
MLPESGSLRGGCVGPCSAAPFRGSCPEPPGSRSSLFLKDEGYTACRSSDAALLSVQALVPEGQATD